VNDLLKEFPATGKTFTVEGRPAFRIQPDSAAPLPWVWYAPVLAHTPGPEMKWLIEKLLAAGIATAGIDVGESFGSPAGRKLYSAFHRELVSHHNFSPRPALLPRSRGGLMLYNWAIENPASVACIAGIYPVCDISSYPGIAKACDAYGLTEAELTAQLATHNPLNRLESLAKARVPIFHIHGACDTVVPLEKNSGPLAENYRRCGGAVTLKIIAGQGHNMWDGWFQSQELLDFVIARIKGATAL